MSEEARKSGISSNADWKDRILSSARSITASARPNTISPSYDFDLIHAFAMKAQGLTHTGGVDFIERAQALLASMPDVEIITADEAREHIEVLFHYTRLRNDLLESISTHSREQEERNLAGTDAFADIEMAAIYKKLQSIEVDIRNLTEGTSSPFVRRSAYDDISIGILGLSIPISSIKETIVRAKRELERGERTNIKYLSSLLTTASQIASAVWTETKRLASSISERISTGVHKIAIETAGVASKAVVLLIRRRIRGDGTLRARGYSKESEAIRLNNLRKQLIMLIEDFRLFFPKSTALLRESALYTFLFYDSSLLEFSAGAVRDMSRDMVLFETFSVMEMNEYICGKAEVVLNNVSSRLLQVEKEIEKDSKRL